MKWQKKNSVLHLEKWKKVRERTSQFFHATALHDSMVQAPVEFDQRTQEILYCRQIILVNETCWFCGEPFLRLQCTC